MKQKCFQSIDALILGIKTILSKFRCSFSDEEQALLQECITRLEQSKTEVTRYDYIKTGADVIGTIVRIFTIADHFDQIKDLF